MLLILSEHPDDRRCDALLSNGVGVPTAVALLLALVFGMEGHRAQHILQIEIEDQAFGHIQFADTKVHVVRTTLSVISGCHRGRPVAVQTDGPVLWEVG